jgi:hypothetical protein
MVCLRSAWQKVKNADVVENSPELVLKRKTIQRRVEIFWLRFGPFFQSFGKVPEAIILFFRAGPCHCERTVRCCKRKKIDDDEEKREEQEQEQEEERA